jgi:DNA-binding GntR family transcriptional regulator
VNTKNPRKAVAVVGEGTRLRDVAYARVFEIMYERKLPAGAFVSQTDLVGMTGVPVAPLRDALRTLEAEGVLTIHPHSGIQFIKPGMELTRSTYQFRGIIEAAAVAVYADTAADADIWDLLRRHQEVEQSIVRDGLTPQNAAGLEQLEESLHGTIVASLSNPLIDTSYRRIRNYLKLLRLDRKMSAPLALRSLHEHLAVLEACRARNPPAAVAAIQSHFAAALQRNLGLY